MLPILFSALTAFPPPPAWHTDYPTAQAEAKKSGQPILAVLH